MGDNAGGAAGGAGARNPLPDWMRLAGPGDAEALLGLKQRLDQRATGT